MTIELNAQGVARYRDLADNPIYYFHAFQYTNGGFYRAVLGYESVWDEDFEEKLIKALDYILHWHHDRNEYFFEEILFTKRSKLWGLKWRRGVKPELDFRYQFGKPVKRTQRALARINLLDRPHHVDIEFDDGEIFTVSYVRYLRFRKSNLRSPKNENLRPIQPEPARATTQARERTALPSAEGLGQVIPFTRQNINVPGMRKGSRGFNPLF